MAKNAPDLVAEAARLEEALELARESFRADTSDAYLKLQYVGAQEELVRFRGFWRGVDATVDMSASDYGRPTGGGRRGGEFIKTEEG